MLKNELKEEIEKWTEKLNERFPGLESKDNSGEEILENARAYRRDSEHFLEEGNLIQSYESLIWAWAFIEIGEKLNHLAYSEQE